MPPKKGKKVKTETNKVEDKMKATMKKLEKFDAEDFIENSAAFTTIEDSLGSPPTHFLFHILRPCLFYILFFAWFFRKFFQPFFAYFPRIFIFSKF